eukprot:90867-Pyramimonas_sp.AAC.1
MAPRRAERGAALRAGLRLRCPGAPGRGGPEGLAAPRRRQHRALGAAAAPTATHCAVRRAPA